MVLYGTVHLSRLSGSASTGLPPFVTPDRAVGIKSEGVRVCGNACPFFLQNEYGFALTTATGDDPLSNIYDFAFFDGLGFDGFLFRTNESPRFNSAVKSVSSVATCTGLPDSFPSQALSSSGVVST